MRALAARLGQPSGLGVSASLIVGFSDDYQHCREGHECYEGKPLLRLAAVSAVAWAMVGSDSSLIGEAVVGVLDVLPQMHGRKSRPGEVLP